MVSTVSGLSKYEDQDYHFSIMFYPANVVIQCLLPISNCNLFLLTKLSPLQSQISKSFYTLWFILKRPFHPKIVTYFDLKNIKFCIIKKTEKFYRNENISKMPNLLLQNENENNSMFIFASYFFDKGYTITNSDIFFSKSAFSRITARLEMTKIHPRINCFDLAKYEFYKW